LPIRPEGLAGSDEAGKPSGGSARNGKRNDNTNTSNSVKGTSHSGEVITKARMRSCRKANDFWLSWAATRT
jgi:hypothetical protein